MRSGSGRCPAGSIGEQKVRAVGVVVDCERMGIGISGRRSCLGLLACALVSSWSLSAVAIVTAQAGVPEGKVAIVAEVGGGLGVVSRGGLRRSVVQVRAVERMRWPTREPAPDDSVAAKGLSQILESVYVQAEAAERGVKVSKGALVRHYGVYVRRTFNSAQQYRSYLVGAKLTVKDVVGRVRDRLLGTRILLSVVHAVSGDREAEVEALQAFARDYRKKWRSRTACEPRFRIVQCDNVMRRGYELR
jgi:hypothetical protein